MRTTTRTTWTGGAHPAPGAVASAVALALAVIAVVLLALGATPPPLAAQGAVDGANGAIRSARVVASWSQLEPAVRAETGETTGEQAGDGVDEATRAPVVGTVRRAWPLCPDRGFTCSEEELAGVELVLSLDAFSLRRNDPHDSIERILEQSRRDVAPLVEALEEHFAAADVDDPVERLAFVQGLVQAVVYALDDTTGWTEYPKFAVEFFVDAQGDCDDAAIAMAVLLEGLGYDAWFVSWRGPEGGHLSTAVTPDRPGLAQVEETVGSPWVETPDGGLVLHVDGVGSPEGCGRPGALCGGVGFTPWPDQGLEVVQVVRSVDPELARRMPLAAWNTAGLIRPGDSVVDRRSTEPAEIRRQVRSFDQRERNRGRVEVLVSALAPPPSTRLREPLSPFAWWGMVTALVGFLALLAWQRILAWRRLRARVEAQRRERALRRGEG